MINSSSNWQDAINSQLAGRLVKPLTQAGVMKMDMSQKIIGRSDRILNRLPLLSQQMQRWGNVNTLSSEAIPIVYARPRSGEVTQEPRITSSEAQVATPQLIPNNLSSKADMPLQAKFDNTGDRSSASSSLNSMPTQASADLTSEVEETNIPIAEYPLVSPQAIANHSKTVDIPLQAKFAASEGVSSLSSPSMAAPTTPTILGSISGSQERYNSESAAYPIVSPKVRANDLAVAKEMLLVKNNLEISEEPHLIAQAKSSNSSVSSSLPVVSRLNTLVSSSQPQSDTNLSKIRPNQWENLTAQIFSPTNPITTAIATTPSQIPQVDPVIREKPLSSNPSNPQDYRLPIVKPKSSVEANMLNVKDQGDHSSSNPHILPVVTISSSTNLLKSTQSYPLTAAAAPSRNSPLRSQTQAVAAPESPKTQVFASPSPPTETVVSSMSNQPQTQMQSQIQSQQVDIDAIANQVERKLMRKLVVESERRGQKR